MIATLDDLCNTYLNMLGYRLTLILFDAEEK